MHCCDRLVGSRASVPKEQVYPKFGAMATLWASLDDHLRHVRSREAIYRALVPFQSSFTPTYALPPTRCPVTPCTSLSRSPAARHTLYAAAG